MLALSFGVLEATESVLALAVILAVSALLQSATSLIAGVWADRLPRVRLMLASDLVRMVTQLGLAAMFLSGVESAWALLPLVATYWVATAFFQPALTGLIPQVLHPHELVPGNGMLGSARSISQIMGGALGAVLVAFFGPGWATVVDAGTFAVSALLLFGLKDVPAADRSAEVAMTIAEDLRVGLREVLARRWIWTVILNASLFLMLYQGPMEVLGPYIAREELGGAAAWGVVATGLMIGAAIGAWIGGSGRIAQPMRLSILLFFAAVTAPLLLAVEAPIWAITVAFFVVGMSFGLFDVVWHSALQKEIPADRISRVSSWDWMGSLAGLPIGFALAGVLTELVGSDVVLVGMSVSAFFLTVWMLLVPDVRRIGAREPRAEQPVSREA